jgi:predicted aspartyl protease
MRSGSADDHCDPARRRLTRRSLSLGAAGGLAIAGLWPFETLARTSPIQTSDPATPAPPDIPEPVDGVSLFSNLFTRMSVRTRLNGRGPYHFVIDTGASRTAIAEETALELGLPPAGEVLVHGVTSAERAQTVRLGRLDAAGRRFTDLQPCLFPRALLAADGLLGLDVLARYHLEMDLAQRTVTLTPSGPDRVAFGRAFASPTRLGRFEPGRSRRGRFGQLILLNARIEGVTAACFVDSGAQYSIGNPVLQHAIGARQERTGFLNPIRVFGVTGQVLQALPGEVSQLEIARHRLGPTRLLFADLHAFRALELDQRPALLLGADILSRFSRVSLDFGLERMNFGGLRRPLRQIDAT